MRGSTLAAVRNKLKAELGFANVVNAVEDFSLNSLIDNKQAWIAGEYDWPFMQHRWDLAVTTGTVYFDIPAITAEGTAYTTNFDRPFKVEVLYNLKWQRVDYGIGAEEYNIWGTTTDPRNDPVQRWQFFDGNRVEVWPMAASPQTLRFTGQRYPTTLLTNGVYDDTKTLDLDDLLVVYYCAAERLLRSDQKDAEVKLKLAAERMRIIRANYPSRARDVIYGNDEYEQKQLRRNVPIIGVAGGGGGSALPADILVQEDGQYIRVNQ